MTPQPKNSVKQSDKGKQPMNLVSGNEKKQVEVSQNKSIDTNNLEKVVIVPEQISYPSKNQEVLRRFSNKIKPSVYLKSYKRSKFKYPYLI